MHFGRGPLQHRSSAFGLPRFLKQRGAIPYAVQHRIDSAGPQPIAVPTQLLDDSQTENRSLCRVMQNVQSNQTDVEFLISSFGVPLRHSVTFGRYPIQSISQSAALGVDCLSTWMFAIYSIDVI